MSDILINGMTLPNGTTESIIIGLNQQGVLGAAKSRWNGMDWEIIEESTDVVVMPPHGRLIDADALLPKSGYDPMMFKHKYDGDHRTQYDTLMGYEILGIVEDAPTVLEAST